MSSSNSNGIYWMLTHGLVISVMMTLVKAFAAGFSIIPVISIYTGIAFVFIATYFSLAKQWHKVSTERIGFHLGRSFLNVTGYIAYYYGLENATLAGATAVSFLLPLCVCLLGVFFFQESLTKARFVNLCLGFVGVLIIANPSTYDVNWRGIMAILISVVAWSGCDIITKQNGQTESVHGQLIYTSLFSAILTAPLSLSIYDYGMLYDLPIWLFIALAILFVLQVICIFQSFRNTDFAVVMPFDYLRLPISIAIGFIYFDEIISINAMFGAMIIIAGNYNLLRSEQRAN